MCRLHLNREKNDNEFTTFLSYEAVDAIKNYIETERKYKYDEFLFQKLYLTRSDYPQLTEDLVEQEYRTLNDDRLKNKQKEKGAFRNITSHMLRKFFNTQFTNSGMGYEPRKHMMGHTIPGVDNSYYLNNPAELQDLYIQYMNKITINPTKTLTIETEEYKELKKQLDENKRESEAKDKEMAEVKKKQEVLERMVQELMEKQLNK